MEEKKVNISDIPEEKEFEDYPEDTIFIFEERPMKRGPITGRIIYK